MIRVVRNISILGIVTAWCLVTINAHVCMLQKRRDPSKNIVRWSLPSAERCMCQAVVAPQRRSPNTCSSRDSDEETVYLWFIDDPDPLTRRSNWTPERLDELLDRKQLCLEMFDKESPEIQSCPSNITSNMDPEKPTAMVVWTKPEATDNSGNVPKVTCNPTSGSDLTSGLTEVVCQATDRSNNRATCNFYVIVTDNEAPKMQPCPSNLSKDTNPEKSTAMVVWTEPAATDNSEKVPNVTCNPISGSNFTIGQTEVVCEATDRSDNKATCYFYVNVIDDEAPKMQPCPSNLSKNTDPEKSTAMVVWTEPAATDNSEKVPNVTCNPISGSNFTIGQTEVVCEATDRSDNKASCYFYVNVTVSLAVNCPQNQIVNAIQGQTCATVSYPDATTTGGTNPVVMFYSSGGPGATHPVGTQTVYVTATDATSTVSTCQFTVTVNAAVDFLNICNAEMGVWNGTILDTQMTASTAFGVEYFAYYARLCGNRCWRPEKEDSFPWIKIEFTTVHTVSGIITEGQNIVNPAWVQNFYLEYARPTTGRWAYATIRNRDWLFAANTNEYASVVNELYTPVDTKTVRVLPRQWMGECMLRLEILGCKKDGA